ncbi:LptF/LptG family permease [Deinococcus maricopensis]|uniref:LptF/LptG family permease n=1 Tax=Deinococcus maricopensis TaxID=309887 RepID=UPI0002E88145|nr:LptF/LptG family permease [Deinococcus maricopensis]
MLKKLAPYVLREVLPLYVVGALVFLLLTTTDLISGVVGILLSYHPTPRQAWLLYVTQVPRLLNQSLILAIPFAVLVGFGRLAKDSELKATAAGGVRPLNLAWPLLLPAALIGAFVFYNGAYLTPQAQAQWNTAWFSVYRQAPPPPVTTTYTYAQDGTLFSASRVETPQGATVANLTGVLVQTPTETITASTGSWDARAKTWTLPGGWVVRGDARPAEFHTPRTFPQRDEIARPTPPPAESTLPELRAELASGRLNVQERRTYQFNIARRYADAFTALGFAFAASALGLMVRNRAWAVTNVVFLILGFYIVWSTVPQLAGSGALPPNLAAWLPPGLLTLLGAALAWRLR